MLRLLNVAETAGSPKSHSFIHSLIQQPCFECPHLCVAGSVPDAENKADMSLAFKTG